MNKILAAYDNALERATKYGAGKGAAETESKWHDAMVIREILNTF